MHVSEKEVKTVASNKEAEKPVTKKEARKLLQKMRQQKPKVNSGNKARL